MRLRMHAPHLGCRRCRLAEQQLPPPFRRKRRLWLKPNRLKGQLQRNVNKKAGCFDPRPQTPEPAAASQLLLLVQLSRDVPREVEQQALDTSPQRTGMQVA